MHKLRRWSGIFIMVLSEVCFVIIGYQVVEDHFNKDRIMRVVTRDFYGADNPESLSKVRNVLDPVYDERLQKRLVALAILVITFCGGYIIYKYHTRKVPSEKYRQMDNAQIISLAIKFKGKLRHEIEENHSHSEDMKGWLWKTLIMAEIAHRSFALKIPVEPFEKQYFDRYGAVARHFRDWAMDWVADNYYEISNYIAAYYWPDAKNRYGAFDKDYIPFKTFQLDE